MYQSPAILANLLVTVSVSLVFSAAVSVSVDSAVLAVSVSVVTAEVEVSVVLTVSELLSLSVVPQPETAADTASISDMAIIFLFMVIAPFNIQKTSVMLFLYIFNYTIVFCFVKLLLY